MSRKYIFWLFNIPYWIKTMAIKELMAIVVFMHCNGRVDYQVLISLKVNSDSL